MPSDSPALVLAFPGEPGQEFPAPVAELVALNRAAHPGLNVFAARPAELPSVLGPALSYGAYGEPPLGAVVVPVTTVPLGPFQYALQSIIGNTRVPTDETVLALADPLGPHPLIAQAMHSRLTEAGLARADRVRLLTMVTAADGVVVGLPDDRGIAAEAEVTCVLLASRLAIPVLPAPIPADVSHAIAAVGSAAERLRAAGAVQVALSPALVGPEVPVDLRTVAHGSKTEPAAPIGAQPALVQLIAERYATALEKAWAAMES